MLRQPRSLGRSVSNERQVLDGVATGVTPKAFTKTTQGTRGGHSPASRSARARQSP
jgi:hypothetical protein